MTKVEGVIDVSTIKRCYVPGAIMSETCQTCGNKMTRDLGRDYLSHPSPSEIDTITLYCTSCDTEHNYPCRMQTVKLTLHYDPSEVTLS